MRYPGYFRDAVTEPRKDSRGTGDVHAALKKPAVERGGERKTDGGESLALNLEYEVALIGIINL